MSPGPWGLGLGRLPGGGLISGLGRVPLAVEAVGEGVGNTAGREAGGHRGSEVGSAPSIWGKEDARAATSKAGGGTE